MLRKIYDYLVRVTELIGMDAGKNEKAVVNGKIADKFSDVSYPGTPRKAALRFLDRLQVGQDH